MPRPPVSPRDPLRPSKYVSFHELVTRPERHVHEVLRERGYQFEMRPHDTAAMWKDDDYEAEVMNWCDENIQCNYTMAYCWIEQQRRESVFYFTDLSDAILFKLRWG